MASALGFASTVHAGPLGQPRRHAVPCAAALVSDQGEMADYLEAYASHFKLPVRNGVRVEGFGGRARSTLRATRDRTFVADHVVVAMSSYQSPRVPAFASRAEAGHRPDCTHAITRARHSCRRRGAHRRRRQLRRRDRDGPRVPITAIWMSGRDTGEVPFRINSLAGAAVSPAVVFRLVFHRVLTIRTPIGRKARRAEAHEGRSADSNPSEGPRRRGRGARARVVA